MITFNLPRSSFRGYIRAYRAHVDYIDPHILYQDAREPIYNLIKSRSLALRLRLIICLNIIFSKLNDEGRIQEFYFSSFAERILSRYQIKSAIDNAFSKLFQRIETFTKNGSGWTVKKINFLDINLGNYRDIRNKKS